MPLIRHIFGCLSSGLKPPLIIITTTAGELQLLQALITIYTALTEESCLKSCLNLFSSTVHLVWLIRVLESLEESEPGWSGAVARGGLEVVCL
jgi:hypothetical protein